VTRIIQSTGHNTSTSSFNRFSPTGQKQPNFYASSAPNSSLALQSHPSRPPVPLWTSNSTGNVPQSNQISNQQHRRVMSTSGLPSGEFDPFESSLTVHPLNSNDTEMDSIFNDFDAPFGDATTSDTSLFDMGYSNNFATINEPTSSQAPITVSPKDLVKEAESAPPSTAFTNLSTPMSAFDHSPSLSSYQTSPMEDYLSFDDPYNGPLFPDANVDTSPASFHTKSFPNNVSYAAAPLTRNKSSPGQSPGTAHGRHSSVSGVNSRRSGKALGPVSCDKADPVSVKRARNTEAARKSRARKLERVENLEETIEGLKAQLEQTAAERDYYRQLAQGRSS
jgi:hypothetical protein